MQTTDKLKKIQKAAWAAGVLCLTAACGIDEYAYVPQVPPQSIVELQMNNKATIKLPSSVSSSYFTNFSIVYRIYISGQLDPGQIQTSEGALNTISPALRSDYTALYSYTDVTNSTASAGVGNEFKNKGYYEVALQGGATLLSVLGPSSFGRTVILDFPPNTGAIPTLTRDSTVYNLLRSKGDDKIHTQENKPLPADNRYFLNSSDLNTDANIDTTARTNLDIAAGNLSTGASRFAYVSLYIVAVGMNPTTQVPIFSKPTFIGILRLPESS
jgi:hypothetical protein